MGSLMSTAASPDLHHDSTLGPREHYQDKELVMRGFWEGESEPTITGFAKISLDWDIHLVKETDSPISGN